MSLTFITIEAGKTYSLEGKTTGEASYAADVGNNTIRFTNRATREQWDYKVALASEIVVDTVAATSIADAIEKINAVTNFSPAPGGSGARTYAGVIDYGDTSTIGNRIEINAGAANLDTFVNIPNNGLGAFSVNTVQGVTDILDVLTGKYDLNELKIGDLVDFRVELKVTTLSPNANVQFRILFAEGDAIEFGLQYGQRFYPSAVVDDDYIALMKFDINNQEFIDNPLVLQVRSDKAVSILNVGVRNWLHL